MLPITKQLIPAGRENRPAHPMTPKYITVHNTGNTGVGANAKSHADYLLKPEAANAPVSWHYTVDDHSIYQHIPDNESAYHATDGAGQGNRASIGIEICVNSDGDYTKAEANAIELIRYLMNKYGIPVAYVVPHQKWYPEKYCPYKILPRWDKFINTIKSGAAYTPPTPNGAISYTIKPGDNLWTIARDNGLEVADILKLNPAIGDPSKIYVGQAVLIPVYNAPVVPPPPTYTPAPKIYTRVTNKNYTMKDNDTIWAISRTYETTVDAILKANPGIVPTAIKPGTVIKVPVTTTVYPQLKYGHQGESVKVMQNALAKVGYYKGMVDGIFGGGTEGAVREFQKAYGITADGICGATTWKYLKKYV